MVLKFAKNDLIIIIPAHNEEAALPSLLESISSSITDNILVVDNASKDKTRAIAEKAGVSVIYEKQLGYGNACLAAINHLHSLSEKPKSVCFFDGDGQSLTDDIHKVADLVLQGKVEYCQGSRMINHMSKSSLGTLASVANRFFSFLLSVTYGQKITDLGPLRIITWRTLQSLEMKTASFGWTMEMSSKILKAGIIHAEVPVSYDSRTKGKSKISGNIKSAFKAALVMTVTFLDILFFWRPTNRF
ncbi:MAG: glycosyltransferase family 2 protein [Candidatus Hodarchaeales archaeon]|jgi:glycosyltransferase involved in cell wall biosynthesis